MKKILVLCIALISMAALTSCKSSIANANTADGVKIEMQLNENYDDTEPFINEKLFCVSNDLENVTAKCELEMDGEKGILDIFIHLSDIQSLTAVCLNFGQTAFSVDFHQSFLLLYSPHQTKTASAELR